MSHGSATPNASPSALKARWVFPVAGPPIDGGVVTIHGDRIVAVGKTSDIAPRDLGDVAILPGLVNAHTHLEFSELREPVGAAGMPLPEWIRLVVAYRRSRATEASDAIARGIRESIQGGVCALGEIATSDWRREPITNSTTDWPNIVLFHESIAPTDERIEAAGLSASAFLATALDARPLVAGLSPHAPYTVHVRLLEQLCHLAAANSAPIAMHLAESREELELLRTGGGPFKELLEAAGAWNPSRESRYQAILEYLEQLWQAPRSLVVHGNYLTRDEIQFLADRRRSMSVVYCPRTHEYFRHEAYPLAEMIGVGVQVALGTDSRASNPDLDLFKEMRHVAHHHPAVAPSRVLELGTLAGARALGFDAQLGTLEAGKLANLAIVRLTQFGGNEPHAALWNDGAKVSETWLRGRPISGRHPTAGNS